MKFKTKMYQFTLPMVIFFLLISCGKKANLQKAPDTQAKEIIDRIQTTKKEILAYQENGKKLCESPTDCLFLSFWDFDGTILKGDCSEGLKENGQVVYKGLEQVAIEAGLSSKYDKSAYEKFEKDYKELDEKQGHEVAYGFIAQIYEGKNRKELEKFSTAHFETVLQNYYFDQSIQIFNSMRDQSDFRVYIISASPDFFVKGSSTSVKVPFNQIRGINLEDKNDVLTNKVILPMTYAEGKTKTILKVVDEIKAEGKYKNIFVLAGFGNSYHTDGNFLKYISTQKLVTGKPLAVMINGGTTPSEYEGFFYKVSHSKTTSGK